jgi:hypothetical protein
MEYCFLRTLVRALIATLTSVRKLLPRMMFLLTEQCFMRSEINLWRGG